MRPSHRWPRAAALLVLSILLSPVVALAPGASAEARRMPPPVAVQHPDAQLQDLLRIAGAQSQDELRACDSHYRLASAPPAQASFRVRTIRGRLVVRATATPGGRRYTGCLETTFSNAITRAAQNTRQTLPPNTSSQQVVVPMGRAVNPGAGAPVPTQPPPGQPQYSPVFQESGRYTVRNVSIAGQGPVVTLPSGGIVDVTMEVQHNCPGCGGAINQVLVGLGGEAQAQQCVWNGGARSRGFETVRFQLRIPNQPGTYEVRTRYSQAYSCSQGALGWWRVDRPNGPDASSNIGLVMVAGQTAPVPVPVQPPPPTQAGDLLINGGFEAPSMSRGSYQTLASIPGWQLSSGQSIEVQNNVAGSAAEGQQFVELDSQSSSGIYQDVRTTPGQRMALRLAFAARPGTAAIDNRVEVRVNGETVALLEADGSRTRDTQWSVTTVYFTAASASTRVELVHVGRSNGYGGYVDDVSLTPATSSRGRGGVGRRGRRGGRGRR